VRRGQSRCVTRQPRSARPRGYGRGCDFALDRFRGGWNSSSPARARHELSVARGSAAVPLTAASAKMNHQGEISSPCGSQALRKPGCRLAPIGGWHGDALTRGGW
jgi:hypothetical protein